MQDNSQSPPESQGQPQEEAPEALQESPQPDSPSGQEETAPEEAQEEGDASEGSEEKPTEAKAEETPDAKHKRTGGYQRKIDRLERQNQELIAALTARGGQPPTPTSQEKTPEERAHDYINDMVNKRLAERDAQREAQTRQSEFQRRMTEARTQHPDFEDVVLSASDVPVSQAVSHALLTSEKGPEIMYQLAKSPAELARLSALSPLDAAREIGRLEAKLASGAAPQKPKSAVRPPVPPSNVGGSSAKSTRNLDDLPISEFKRAMRSRGR